ncbi:MFS transporter, partial [Pseudomonas fragi]|nr:MFS transporter [Pseudomonas sp. GC01]
LSQPLAGLLIALLAAPLGTQTVILWLTGSTALIGVTLVTLARRR